MDGAEVGKDLFRGGLDGVFAGDVEGVGFGGAPSGGDSGGDSIELFDVAGGECDGGALSGEGEGAGASDACDGTLLAL
jgi:hypothetical protein